ncbi:MAG: hypothetical protein IPL65_18230 [Lewinellaceae bacterium]|nr:hypothetical protein [Lewinellaceae bacterium]
MVQLSEAPDRAYDAAGNYTVLIDGRMGSSDLHSGAWLGFSGEDAVVDLTWKQAQSFSAINISALTNTGAWVYPPRKIEIWATKGAGRDFQLVSETTLTTDDLSLKEGSRVYLVSFPKIQSTMLRIRIQSWGSLPPGHPGAGNPAWLFLDEIFWN